MRDIIKRLERQITKDEEKQNLAPSFSALQNTVRLRECLAQVRAREGQLK